jgi:hypothetical protein
LSAPSETKSTNEVTLAVPTDVVSTTR